MKRYLWVLIVLFFVASSYADDKFTLSGSLKEDVSVRIQDFNSDLSKLKTIGELAGQYKIKGDELVLFSKVKYFYDFAYGLRDKLDRGGHYMESPQRADWLRDCYLDYTKGPWFLRLGKQQVVWGQADGVTVLDRVNPVDLSEYWLPDMSDIRIPLWMANINYSPKLDSNIQFLFIPDFEQSTSAPIGAPFTTYAYTRYDNWKKGVLAGGGNVNENIYFPGKKFENSTFGLQWSDRVGDLSYTLNYLDGFYYSARNTTILVSGGGGPGSQWKVDRAFKRYGLYGSSFNKTFTNPSPMQGITLRGDLAVINKEPTYYGDPDAGSAKGIKRWTNVMWILGADRYVFTKWLLSFQYGQYILEKGRLKSQASPLTSSLRLILLPMVSPTRLRIFFPLRCQPIL